MIDQNASKYISVNNQSFSHFITHIVIEKQSKITKTRKCKFQLLIDSGKLKKVLKVNGRILLSIIDRGFENLSTASGSLSAID